MYKKLVLASALVTFTALLCMDPITQRTRVFSDEDQVTIQAPDGQEFKIEVGRARLSQTLSNLIQDAGVDAPLPVPNISGAILKEVMTLLSYVQNIVAHGEGAVNSQNVINQILRGFDSATLIQFILAVNFLDIPVLLSSGVKIAVQKDAKTLTFNYLTIIPKDIRNLILYQMLLNKLGPVKLKQLSFILFENPLMGRTHIHDFTVTPDGKKFIVVLNKAVTIWDMATKKLLEVYKYALPVGNIFVMPDNKLITITTGELDNVIDEIMVWDLLTGKQLGALNIPSSDDKYVRLYRGASLSPDGTALAVRFGDNFTYIFDIYTRQRIAVLKKPNIAMAYASHKSILFLYGGEIRLVNIQTGAQERMFKGVPSSIRSFQVTPSGTHLVALRDDKILVIFDLKTGLEAASYYLLGEKLFSFIISPDETKIIVSTDDGKFVIFDFKTGKMVGVVEDKSSVNGRFCVTTDSQQLIAEYRSNFKSGSEPSLRMLDLSIYDRLRLLTSEQALEIWNYLAKNSDATWEGIYAIVAPGIVAQSVPPVTQADVAHALTRVEQGMKKLKIDD